MSQLWLYNALFLSIRGPPLFKDHALGRVPIVALQCIIPLYSETTGPLGRVPIVHFSSLLRDHAPLFKDHFFGPKRGHLIQVSLYSNDVMLNWGGGGGGDMGQGKL